LFSRGFLCFSFPFVSRTGARKAGTGSRLSCSRFGGGRGPGWGDGSSFGCRASEIL
jgi:hypothetical protein